MKKFMKDWWNDTLSLVVGILLLVSLAPPIFMTSIFLSARVICFLDSNSRMCGAK